MIKQLVTELKSSQLNYNMASILHGVIMEHVTTEFGDKAHIAGTRDYSQNIRKNRDDKWIWTINTLDDEAGKNIIESISKLNEIELKSKELIVPLENIKTVETSFDELFERHYYGDKKPQRYINLRFVTPTAFKSEGKYVNIPTVRLIISSLMSKYDAISTETTLKGYDTLEQITEQIEISRYNLKSCQFQLEGTKIPAFIGNVVLFVNGNTNLVSMVNMLADFGQYSGIGINSAIGMGAVKYNEERGDAG